MKFQEITRQRYAVKKFNGIHIPNDKVSELLEIIRLAPSAFGLQPWKIKVLSDDESKQKLLEASWNQAQILTCSHLLVFCADVDIGSRINGYEKMMKQAHMDDEKIVRSVATMRSFVRGMSLDQKINWPQRQTYIALANAVNGARALGFDSCPMEGFIVEKYIEILQLPENIIPSALVTIGYSADTASEKIRFSKEDLFF